MAENVCPVWVGHLLANPLRKLIQNPRTILLPHVSPKMTVGDIGCAMGFFSIPMARIVGPSGRVICVDIQEKMLNALKKKAIRAGVDKVVAFRRCSWESFGLEDFEQAMDFILAFAVVHEVPDPEGLFAHIFKALKPGARVLVGEPAGHVSQQQFEKTVFLAQGCGFKQIGAPRIRSSHTTLLEK